MPSRIHPGNEQDIPAGTGGAWTEESRKHDIDELTQQQPADTKLFKMESDRLQRKNLLLQNEIKGLKEELDTSRTFTLIWFVTTLLFGSLSYAWLMDWLGP